MTESSTSSSDLSSLPSDDSADEDPVEAAKSGILSRIFLIGGCVGSRWHRSYFTDLAEATPDDSLILTLGCAKNRLYGTRKG